MSNTLCHFPAISNNPGNRRVSDAGHIGAWRTAQYASTNKQTGNTEINMSLQDEKSKNSEARPRILRAKSSPNILKERRKSLQG